MDFSSILDYLGNCEHKCESAYCDWQRAKRHFQEERRHTVSIWKKAFKQLEKEGLITYDPDYYAYRMDDGCTIKIVPAVYNIYVRPRNQSDMTLMDARFNSTCISSRNKEILERFIEIIADMN